jgi:hypothetical protein
MSTYYYYLELYSRRHAVFSSRIANYLLAPGLPALRVRDIFLQEKYMNAISRPDGNNKC